MPTIGIVLAVGAGNGYSAVGACGPGGIAFFVLDGHARQGFAGVDVNGDHAVLVVFTADGEQGNVGHMKDVPAVHVRV